MIVITGAGGFIGSNLLKYLNSLGMDSFIIVDDWDQSQKEAIITNTKYTARISRDLFPAWLENNHKNVSLVYHLGARTDTTEMDEGIFKVLNLDYSKAVWNACVEYNIPLIYASSAATYGDGKYGYDESMDKLAFLKPLNPYGESKHDFDKWVLKRDKTPPFWVGLKFFNVYGYGEYNKGRMASVVYHAINQIKDTGKMKLFRSHNPEYRDGEQMRDFICVTDVVRICHEFSYVGRNKSGIYNLGTGEARTFADLAKSVFKAMNIEPMIEFIDTPLDIRDKYQYFTEANTDKLKKVGIGTQFIDLEDGIREYVKMVM